MVKLSLNEKLKNCNFDREGFLSCLRFGDIIRRTGQFVAFYDKQGVLRVCFTRIRKEQ